MGGSSLPYWDTGGAGAPLILMHPFAGKPRVVAGAAAAFALAPAFVSSPIRSAAFGSTQPITSSHQSCRRPEACAECARHPTCAFGYSRGRRCGRGGLLISRRDRVISAHVCTRLSLKGSASAGRTSDRRSSTLSGRPPPENGRELSRFIATRIPKGTRRWIEIQQRAQQKPRANSSDQRGHAPEAIAATGVPILLVAANSILCSQQQC